MARIFSAVFPIDSRKTLEDLAKVCSVWIAGSPHNKISPENLTDLYEDNFGLNVGDTSVNTLRADDNSSKTFALRYISAEPELGRNWTSEVVGRKDRRTFYVSYALDYESQKVGAKLDRSVPRILGDVIDGIGGGFDGESLRVKTEPHFLQYEDIDFVLEILKNKSGNSLPVIYLSRDTNENLALDGYRLSRVVSGLAHVMIEPEKAFSFELGRRLDTRKYAYNGHVGIHCPDGTFIKIPPGNNNVGWEIYGLVADISSDLLIPSNLSYEEIRRANALRDILRLKNELSLKAGLSESERSRLENRVLTEFVGELDARDAEIKDLKGKLSRAHKSAGRDQSRTEHGGSILMPAELREIYSGEQKRIVLDALGNYVANLPEGRRKDYVVELISANPAQDKVPDLANEIKRIFRSSSGRLGAKESSELQSLGFIVEGLNGGHVKISVPGSSRFVTVPATPSDYRAGTNSALEVIRRFL